MPPHRHAARGIDDVFLSRRADVTRLLFPVDETSAQDGGVSPLRRDPDIPPAWSLSRDVDCASLHAYTGRGMKSRTARRDFV